MGGLFQWDHKSNMSLFCFLGFTSMLACLGLCGLQGSHSHYSRSSGYGFGIQICQMGSPLNAFTCWTQMWSVLACRVTWGRNVYPWDRFIYADTAGAQSQSHRHLFHELMALNSGYLLLMKSQFANYPWNFWLGAFYLRHCAMGYGLLWFI